MADDVASLGLEVESASVRRATTDMNAMSQSARQLQGSVQGAAQSSQQLTTAQANTIRHLETMIGRTQLAGRELAQFNALRRAGTTADTEAGRAIAALAGIHHDLDRQQQRRAQITERVTGAVLRQVTATLALVAASYSLSSIRTAIDEVGKIGDIADRLKVSSELIQVFRLQVQLAGGTIGEADAAMDRFARTVGQAAQGQGYLVKFLQANNVELRSFMALNLDQQYQVVLRLIAGIQDANKQVNVTQQFFGRGSREVVAVMQNGVQGLLDLYEEMKKNGQILSNETIKEAQRIDDAWTKMTDRMDKSFKRTVVNGAADAERWATFVVGQMERVASAEQWTTIFRKAMFAFSLTNPATAGAAILSLIGPGVTPTGAGRNAPPSRLQGATAGLGPGAPPPAGGGTRVPNISERADDYDRLTKSIRKSIEELNAEAMTAGLSAGAIAAHVKQELLLNAALEAKRKITPELLLQIDELADKYGKAADAAQRAKITVDALFERQLLLLSDTEAKIAQTLRPLYGNNVSAALNSAEASMLRFNEQLRMARDLTVEFSTTFMNTFIEQIKEGAKVWDAFAKAGLSALNRLAQRMLDMAIQQLALKAFGGALALFNVPGLAGSAGAAGAAGAAAAIAHEGGQIGAAGMPRRYVHPAYFENAPRYHNGIDYVGGERPAILKVGERVIPAGGDSRQPQDITVRMEWDVQGYLSEQEVFKIARQQAKLGTAEALALANAGAPKRQQKFNLLEG